jgi:anti-anti-sigma regulatory factor
MEFKIDAKDNYTLITPESAILDANVSDLLAAKCKILYENGSENFIVDLSNCKTANMDAFESLISFTADMYEMEHSFVFTNLNAELLRKVKDADAIDRLNYAPTFIEAVDIINMEILERDLFREE